MKRLYFGKLWRFRVGYFRVARTSHVFQLGWFYVEVDLRGVAK
jgi:hypothetical protein